MGKVENFEDLVIYQKARVLAVHVYEITREGEFKYDTRFFSKFVLRWVQSVITSQRGSKDKEIRSLRTFCILLRGLVGRLGVRYKER